MFYFLLTLILIFFGCSKKSDSSSPQNPQFSKYDILLYWGFGVGKSHKYYSIDTTKFKITNAIDSTSIIEDTFIRIIKDTFGNLNVEFYDSSLSTSNKIYDTLYVYEPFVIDTLKFQFLNSTQIEISNKIFKAPLALNESWVPIESQSKPIYDTIFFTNQQISPCSLRIYVDTFKVDSTIKIVVESGNDSTFKILSQNFFKVKYRYQTKPQTFICNDTTIKKDTAYITSIDTTYLKSFIGILKIYRFDSTYAKAIIGPFPLEVILKSYGRRIRIQ